MTRNQTTIQQHAKFIVENVVADYEDGMMGYERIWNYTYWEVLAMIKHAFEINAFSRANAERYCYHMHCTFDEMMTA